MTVVADREVVLTEVADTFPAPVTALVATQETVPRRLPTAGILVRIRERLQRAAEGFDGALRREHDHGHFFHFVPVFLGAGAVFWFCLGRPPPTAALAVLCCVATCAGLLPAGRNHTGCRLASVAALVLAGTLLADLEARRRATTMLDSGVTTVVTGVVERREAGASGEWRYVVRLTSTAEPRLRRPPERVSLLARGKGPPAMLGEMLTGRARLSPPSGPALPGLNDFSFSSYFDGIGAVGFFLGAPRGLGSGPGEESVWSATERTLFSVRDAISTRIRSVIGGDPGAFAASIITGERRSMSRDATEALRLSGLAHITAISGLNMALASGIFFVGLRMALSLLPGLAQAFPIKKIAAAGALFAAFAYLLISGYQVSAVRAFLMTAIMLVAVLFDRPAISLRNLALAAIVIIATTPSAVMGPSFQMSFAATAALIAGYAAWRARPRRSPGLRLSFPGARFLGEGGKLMAGTFLTSLIGGLSTAIFAIAHFHRLAPHGLEANLAAMPIISILVMPAGLVAMLLMPFGLDAPFLMLMGIGLEWVLVIAHGVAGWGEAIGFARMPAWFLPVASIGLLLMTLLRTWLRHAGSALLAAVIATAVLVPSTPPADVMISEDGRLVGLRLSPQGLATNRARPPRFIFEQWQAALGADEHLGPADMGTAVTGLPAAEAPAPAAPPAKSPPATTTPDRQAPKWTEDDLGKARERMRGALKSAGEGRFVCEGKSWCVARLGSGWAIATVEDAAFVGGACDVADIVVSARRVAFASCRSGARLFTAETLRRSGAVELWFGDRKARDIRVIASFSGGYRPWSAHRLYDWRSDSFQADPVLDGAIAPTPTGDSGGPAAAEDVSDSGE
ncbi:ComEC/Rec2 family competence protein [Ciceribacter selenitireducens]|uniref:ComEC/Rec2 family competence protein n=1 Tax=Ciceribacter selenitireducens TaxID=448181 RepID=UPI0004B382E2|nr:ComEC/Rec2 family competence protein [Ciceribacter selenitireducens]